MLGWVVVNPADALAQPTSTAGHASTAEASKKIAGNLMTENESTSDTAPESAWLLTPTFSVDPKLGTNGGALVAYLPKLDPDSNQSMIAAAATYSNTDSLVGAIFADLYWDNDKHKLTAGLIYGDIKNSYDDFLGTGVTAKTQDQLRAGAIRYRRRFGKDWYLGAQLIRSNYTIEPGMGMDDISEGIGLIGFDSTGIGALAEFDSRNDPRNPIQGTYFLAENIAYREALGGEDSFDILGLDIRHYFTVGIRSSNSQAKTVIAVQWKNRWSIDAPLAGYSSIVLPGYTRGNYLNENMSHLMADVRLPINKRWGFVAYGGVGCLFAESSQCGKEFYPAIGGGISYLVKPEAGIVARLEVAKGKDDNSAIYLRFGHPF